MSPILYLDWRLRAVGLDIWKAYIYLWVLQFVVLVEAPLRPIGLPADFDSALVVSFNLISIAPHPLILLIAPFARTNELIVLE